MIAPLSRPGAALLGYRKPETYAVIYTWSHLTDMAGTVEVRYRRERHDTRLAREVLELKRAARRGGSRSPYSISTLPEHTL